MVQDVAVPGCFRLEKLAETPPRLAAGEAFSPRGPTFYALIIYRRLGVGNGRFGRICRMGNPQASSKNLRFYRGLQTNSLNKGTGNFLPPIPKATIKIEYTPF
jgi:hypothetical protein